MLSYVFSSEKSCESLKIDITVEETLSIDDVVVCITNHNHNKNAFQLKKSFLPFCDTLLIDSGSNENIGFDIKLGNVF